MRNPSDRPYGAGSQSAIFPSTSSEDFGELSRAATISLSLRDRARPNKSFGYAGFLARFLCLIEQPTPLMEKLGSGFITTTEDVDRLEFDWGKIHFLSEPQVTNAEHFSFGIVELAQGQGHARHNHPGSEEIIYVVSGEGEQMVDDQPPVNVGPGASIYIPADIFHSTVNTGNQPMKLIVVYSPAGPERLLREIPGCQVIAATPQSHNK